MAASASSVLQDEIVRRIATTLNLQLALAQRGVLIPRRTENLEAYDEMLRGMELLLTWTQDVNTNARRMFEQAIALDPKIRGRICDARRELFLGLGCDLKSGS